MIYSKTVLKPIKVPVGIYCWGEGRICGSYDYEGGYGTCDRDLMWEPIKCPEGALKPKECLELKEN